MTVHATPPASEAPLLQIRGLEVTFGRSRTRVLHGVDITVGRGERVAIVGQSGSGKSTVIGATLHLLPGSGRLSAGSIEFAGEELATAREPRMRRVRGRRISLVPQDPLSNLNPALRVGTQIEDALETYGMARREARRARAVELMEAAGIPDAARRMRQYPHEFSGGMRQRVLIAIALAGDPELLIADEPTSALDVTVQKQILARLQRLVDERGTALLFVTHDLGLAADSADRIVVMHDGRVVEEGPPGRVLLAPDDEYTKRLIAAAPLAHTPREERAASDGGAMLVARDVVKEFAVRGTRGERMRAVDDVSFSLARGTTLAVVGESGSGKTTMARIALGLEQPTSGGVLVDGEPMDTRDRRLRRELRRKVQPIFQDPYGSLDPMFTIERIIEEPLHIFRVGDRASRRARVAELLDQVALPRSIAQRSPSELSGGQRQRVAIARALALEPELVVCDEAVSALDVLVQEQILTLLQELQGRLGVSYLFITHDLGVVRQIAHEVIVMRRGAIVESGPVARIFDAPEEEYTRELIASIPGKLLGSAA